MNWNRVLEGQQLRLERERDRLSRLQDDRLNVIMRSMLGRWVSELEPSLALQSPSGRVLGLAARDQPQLGVLVAYLETDGPQAFDFDSSEMMQRTVLIDA